MLALEDAVFDAVTDTDAPPVKLPVDVAVQDGVVVVEPVSFGVGSAVLLAVAETEVLAVAEDEAVTVALGVGGGVVLLLGEGTYRAGASETPRNCAFVGAARTGDAPNWSVEMGRAQTAKGVVTKTVSPLGPTAGCMTVVPFSPGGINVRLNTQTPVAALRLKSLRPTAKSATQSVLASLKAKPCGATRPVRPSDTNVRALVEGATPTVPVVEA